MADQLRAFEAFDWENDPDWQAYLCRVEVPPGREAALAKVKARWYRREVDPDCDVALAGGDAAAAPTADKPEPSAASSPPPPQQQKEQGKAKGAAAGAASAARPNFIPAFLLVSHAVLVVTAVLSLQPFSKLIAWRSYWLFCLIGISTHPIRIYARHGLPRLASGGTLSERLRSAGDWVGTVGLTTDFHLLVLCLMCRSSPVFRAGVIPVAVMAAYHASAYLASVAGGSAVWRRAGLPLHRWLAGHQEQALLLNATVEVSLGFLVAFACLRGGFKSIFSMGLPYWVQLKRRLESTESRAQHLAVWSFIGGYAWPLLAKVPPLYRFVQQAAHVLGGRRHR